MPLNSEELLCLNRGPHLDFYELRLFLGTRPNFGKSWAFGAYLRPIPYHLDCFTILKFISC